MIHTLSRGPQIVISVILSDVIPISLPGPSKFTCELSKRNSCSGTYRGVTRSERGDPKQKVLASFSNFSSLIQFSIL